MKAKIKFKLPEEQENFEVTVNAFKYKQLAIEMDRLLRGKIKHGDYQEETLEQLEEVRNFMHEFAANENIEVI